MNDGVKKAMLDIEIPKELHQRALDGIAKVPKRSVFMYKKVGIIAAALALVLCASVGAAAVGGHFVDIKNIFGTVTGQQYVDATDDISVNIVKTENGGLVLQPLVNKTAQAPYSEIETLKLGSYSIEDENGNIVADGIGGETVAYTVNNDTADTIYVTVLVQQEDGTYAINELESGTYTINIKSFIGESKADQPLEIFGDWNAEFTFINYYEIPETGMAFTVAGEDPEEEPVVDWEALLGAEHMHTYTLGDPVDEPPLPDGE